MEGHMGEGAGIDRRMKQAILSAQLAVDAPK